MATAAPTFAKKTVYHSMLKGAGPLTVQFVSEVKDSQYKGRPPYVVFKVDGDSGEYQYTIENGAIAEDIKSVSRGDWVEILAGGGKENDATLEITFLNEQPQQQRQSAQQQGRPPRQTQQPEANGDSLAKVLWRCLETSAVLVDKFEEKHGPMTENHRALAINLAIEMHRNNTLPLTS